MRSISTRKMLMRAMHMDDSRLFRSILEKEGWPTDSEWSDYELLVFAVKSNSRRITHLLLDKGARVKKANVKRLSSPLHVAAVKKTAGWSKVVARLLSRGASVEYKNNNTDTALHAAFKSHAPDEIVDMLLLAHLSKSSVDVFNREALGFIHIACTRTNLEVVRELVEADHSLVNGQVDSKFNTPHAGYTPLHFAVDHGRLEIAEYLLKNGADIYRQNINGSTPLHLALELRNIEMIDLLLSHDTLKINKVNNFGLSHFMAVCTGSNQDLIDTYLQKTSSISALISSQVQDVRSYPHSSYTPLHFAAEFGRQRIVELLLSKEADCCSLARDNITPHVLAHHGGHKKIACLLDKQCRIYQWSTESSKVLGNRYNPVFNQDNQGDIVISFEKKVDSNDTDFSSEFESSSDQESTKSDDYTNALTIAQFSHDDLVAKQVDIPTINMEFSENLESSKYQSVDSQTFVTAVQSKCEPLDLSPTLRKKDHLHRVVKNMVDNSVVISSSPVAEANFEEMPNNSFTRSDTLIPTYQSEAMQSQFSTLCDFSSFNPVATSTFVSHVSQSAAQNTCFDKMDSIPNFIDEIPSIQTSSDFIQLPEVYSIPWSSFSSQNYFDFTTESHTSDSGIARTCNSFVSSYFTDSGIGGNVSQSNLHNGLYNQSNFLNPHVSQNAEEIDYSGFFTAPSSTPVNDVPC